VNGTTIIPVTTRAPAVSRRTVTHASLCHRFHLAPHTVDTRISGGPARPLPRGTIVDTHAPQHPTSRNDVGMTREALPLPLAIGPANPFRRKKFHSAASTTPSSHQPNMAALLPTKRSLISPLRGFWPKKPTLSQAQKSH
jgi:hypothetical protein